VTEHGPEEEAPRVVIRDKRRIDPVTGQVRTPAGEQPAGGPASAPGADPGEQMSEQDTTVTEEAAAPAGDGDAARQLAERTEDLQRVTAEYANYRRRVDRDRQLVVDQAAERFAAQLFPIVDGLGVQPFGAAGDPFDPALHEAVMHDTSSDVEVPTATTVLRQGFRRGDRVLRTAMVAVSDPERPAEATPTEADEPSA